MFSACRPSLGLEQERVNILEAEGTLCGVASRWSRRRSEGTMKINAGELKRQIGIAGTRGWAPIMNQAERRHKLPAGLLIAIASRETDMNDIVGDNGHGRGLFQIDDRAHTDWLSQHGARGKGTKPPVADAAEFAAALLASNRSFGQTRAAQIRGPEDERERRYIAPQPPRAARLERM